MVTRDTPWPAGTPCWVDVAATDVGAARLFYEQLFGWQIVEGPAEFGGYSNCFKNDRMVAGLSPKMDPAQPSAWSVYLATEDIDATWAAVSKAGAQVIAEPMSVGDIGRMAIAVDPGGAVFGAWQAASHTGIQLANEPGALIWEENMTQNWDANKTFYSEVFGHSLTDMSSGDFRYAVFTPAGAEPSEQTSVGGIGQQADDDTAPPAWLIYFASDDTDASVDEVVRLGGNVIRPASDTPYGRMAIVSDPEGARFAIMAPGPMPEQ